MWLDVPFSQLIFALLKLFFFNSKDFMPPAEAILQWPYLAAIDQKYRNFVLSANISVSLFIHICSFFQWPCPLSL